MVIRVQHSSQLTSPLGLNQKNGVALGAAANTHCRAMERARRTVAKRASAERIECVWRVG